MIPYHLDRLRFGNRNRLLGLWGFQVSDDAVNQALRLQSFRNRDLRQALFPKLESDPQQRRRASGRITRTLQLLRSHELIHRVPKTNYYRLNKKARP